MSEADARKQTMLQILTAAAVMGMQHVNLRRASRMRGGARKEAEVSASAPYQTETVMERLTYTLPAHLWGGEIVETKAPHVRKKRRGEKEPEPEVPEPDLSEAARQRLMEAEHRIREKLLTDTQPIPSDW